MNNQLYRKLYDKNILRRAWHLAIKDTRTDFIEDSFKYNDFAFKLDDNLLSISNALKNEEYHPQPLLDIDIPKSSLSVRPGSVISIEDRIILYAIILLIASKLDNELPETIYSYRLKDNLDGDFLFKDKEILKFPFLKRRTIRKRVDIIEPWYGQWPKFIKKSIQAYEEEGYKFLTISDITAYFENINLIILGDFLKEYFSDDHKIINLLYNLLKYWTWRTTHGTTIDRGIPQGNDVSSFLGNIYLLPLDIEFKKLSKNFDIRYFRYMDDVKIFSKEEEIARKAIFTMNSVLRRLHLNIQGNKTKILRGNEIKKELVDDRLDKINEIINYTQDNQKDITEKKREELISDLKKQYKRIKVGKNGIKAKDMRVYRRIITGFMLLNSSYMIEKILIQLSKNPDERLTNKSVKYFKYSPRSWKSITNGIIDFLESPLNLFEYQEATLISCLKYLKKVPSKVTKYAWNKLKKKNTHWYVKFQCIHLLASIKLKSNELEFLKEFYSKESKHEIKRALSLALCQLKKDELRKFLTDLTYENNKKLFSAGRMLTSLYYNHEGCADKAISDIFRDFNENFLLDFYYKIEVIKHCNKDEVRKVLLKRLRLVKRAIKKEHLRGRVNETIKYLENSLK